MTAWYDSWTEKKIAEFNEKVCPIPTRQSLVARFIEAESQELIQSFLFTSRDALDNTFVYLFIDAEGNTKSVRHDSAHKFLNNLGV